MRARTKIAGLHRISIATDRTVTIAATDHLCAKFNANAWSGRMEGGYPFAPWGGTGLTPNAAA
ncbi:autotransporter outer membrane beta-barrel domain-containing protein [Bradyrhizobium neotropicale]|uniref:autotransporter outer membrane beta-barrel domain-containing protein n=1 Tax=Bradyrhizobium neotropicale TaxID=1497615 RepID=UPI0024C02887|nr:autotransporter outer membrane beta-barrel domain-containing protein [Bradyrhizobium neotropicale]